MEARETSRVGTGGILSPPLWPWEQGCLWHTRGMDRGGHPIMSGGPRQDACCPLGRHQGSEDEGASLGQGHLTPGELRWL